MAVNFKCLPFAMKFSFPQSGSEISCLPIHSWTYLLIFSQIFIKNLLCPRYYTAWWDPEIKLLEWFSLLKLSVFRIIFCAFLLSTEGQERLPTVLISNTCSFCRTTREVILQFSVLQWGKGTLLNWWNCLTLCCPKQEPLSTCSYLNLH